MAYEAKVLADSIASGVRLTTLQVTLPRIVLAEFNTHRVFSRNSASSRAIPVEKRIVSIKQHPFIPDAFGANKKGMQAGDSLEDEAASQARALWIEARDSALDFAEKLAALGVHKQWANRLIEPYSWHTIIVTATEWENFFALRCSPMAQPEIRTAAEMMCAAMELSNPEPLGEGEWHLPFIDEEDWSHGTEPHRIAQLVKLSCARCARVSYLTHDGKRDEEADITLYDRLYKSGHMSPLEHAAQVVPASPVGTYTYTVRAYGNFRAPWLQHRKEFTGEAVFKETT